MTYCKDCFYLSSKSDRAFPYDDYYTKYSCEFHKLYNGEVSRPNEQRCDSWTSIISGNRDIQLGKLGIN